MSAPHEATSAFPQAPSAEAWAALSDAERRKVWEALPSSVTEAELSPPEGDTHHTAREGTRDALRRYFGDDPRGVYVGSELTVYYPASPRFCPDLMVVFGVDPGPREKWVVSHEGKGLDFVLEVHVGGDRKKDAERNVALYARLGIPEYFLFDGRNARLYAWCLPPEGGRYLPILPRGGRYPSRTLGLDFHVEEGQLVLSSRGSPVLTTGALLDRVQATLNEVTQRRMDEARLLDEVQQQNEALAARLADAERARSDAERRVAELERLLRAQREAPGDT